MRDIKYTRNPLVLGYARLRYRVGTWVERALSEREWAEHKLMQPIVAWAWSSESRYNCLIEPWLGESVKCERRRDRATLKAMAAQRRGDRKRAQRWFAESNRWTDRGDANRKLRYPEYVSRLERLAEMRRLTEEHNAQ